jgi:hypothetical protein
MAAGEERAAPARARPRTGRGQLRVREQRFQLSRGSSPSECMTEGQELTISGSGNSDPSLRGGAASAGADVKAQGR